MNRTFGYTLAVIVGLLSIAVIFLLFRPTPPQVEREEPVTDTMIFTEAMRYATPVPMPDSISFAGEKAPLDLFYVREQLDRELTVNTYWHSSTLLTLKRAARWFPVIEPVLRQQGIPDDFKYLALIESGLMNVVSPSGAAGFWQFLEKTGKEYDLKINKEVDERYHVQKSTEAACRYLKKSMDKFGSWTLAAASYNAGPKKISESIDDQLTRSYYELYLSDETSRYIFRILALKCICESPEKYGFKLETGDLYDPLQTNLINISNSIPNLAVFAREHKISYRMLKELNPWLRSDRLSVRKGEVFQIALPVQ
jgi:membrane-bound lytic murein transglycosylase D